MELSLPISDQKEQNKTLAFSTRVYSSIVRRLCEKIVHFWLRA